MRFQSTPRFGSTQSATRQMEDVEEIDPATSQSQSQSQSSATEQIRSDGRDMTSDSIEVDSYADSLASQEEMHSSSSGSSDHEMEEITHTRRQADYMSGLDEDEDEDGTTMMGEPEEHVEEDDETPPVKRRRLSASASPTKLQMATAYDSDAGHDEEHNETEEDEEYDVQDKTRTRAPLQQPTFQPAPRFKPAPEDELLAQDQGSGADALLAAPVTPQRRGAKYLAGGLASQLQGLLSQVKGSETLGGGDGVGDGAIVRLAVEDVRMGTRMHLIQGRVLSRGSVAESEGVVKNYILAGGGARVVKTGSVLRLMAAPAWDVQLDEEWTVACEWTVESLEG